MSSDFLRLVERLHAISKIGLTYCKAPYDLERYAELADIANDLARTVSSVDPEAVRRAFEKDVGYVTPKVDVRALVFRGEEILLVRERSDGLWTAPGGWADVGQSPSEAVEKEVREESGYTARAVRLLALYDRTRHAHPPMAWHVYKAFFLCALTGGSPKTSTETDEIGFFRIDALPALSTPRVTAAQITSLYERARDPSLPCLFD